LTIAQLKRFDGDWEIAQDTCHQQTPKQNRLTGLGTGSLTEAESADKQAEPLHPALKPECTTGLSVPRPSQLSDQRPTPRVGRQEPAAAQRLFL
jgi:hypothetical protein